MSPRRPDEDHATLEAMRRVLLFVALAAGCLDLESLQVDGDATTPTCDGGACVNESGPMDGDMEATPDGEAGCPPAQQSDSGACLAVCAGKVCGLHAGCAPNGDCACVVGYSLSGTDCVFSGGPLDPGFQNTPPAWILDGGVTLDPADDGGIEPGVATFTNTCATTEFVSQTFPMAAFTVSEPLALETNIRCKNCDSSNSDVRYGLGTRSAYITLGGVAGFQLTRTCLGERAYGGDISLSFSRRCVGFTLDHAAFVPAADCPAPGSIANGSFETPSTSGKPGEWKISGSGGAVGTCPTGYCATLATSDGCSNPSLLGGPISVPQSMTKPALRFSLNAPTNVEAQVMLLGPGSGGPVKRYFVGKVKGTEGLSSMTLCLPDWSRGMTWPIELSVPPVESGTCNPRVTTSTIDNLEVVSEPTCEDPGFIFDPSFERGGDAFVYTYVPLDPSLATVRINSVGAHSGTNYVDMRASGTPLRTRSLVVPITVPEGGHPAFSYYYTAAFGGAVTDRSARISIDGASGVDIPDAATWTLATACLPVAAAGRGIDVVFTVRAAEYSADVRLELDDFSVSNDAAACP
jgi:hypothetical protein